MRVALACLLIAGSANAMRANVGRVAVGRRPLIARRAMRVGLPAAPHPLASSAAMPAVPEPSPSGGELSKFQKFSELFSNLFPLWTVLSAGVALKAPQSLAWFTTSYFTAALAMLMLSMGITLTVDDFKRVLSRPGPVGLGFVLCYAMMPLLALGIAKALALPAPLTAGLVLIGCINGGQVSAAAATHTLAPRPHRGAGALAAAGAGRCATPALAARDAHRGPALARPALSALPPPPPALCRAGCAAPIAPWRGPSAPDPHTSPARPLPFPPRVDAPARPRPPTTRPVTAVTAASQASNLCTYIARGDVALSVIMTTSTTIGAPPRLVGAARARPCFASSAPSGGRTAGADSEVG